MDIVRANFGSSLESIKRDIKDAAFVTLDFEFTGLGEAQDKIDLMDTVQDRYAKLRASVARFLPVQMVCLFRL